MERVNYGVYDVHQRFSEAKGVAIEHIFVSWLSSEFETPLAPHLSMQTPEIDGS